MIRLYPRFYKYYNSSVFASLRNIYFFNEPLLFPLLLQPVMFFPLLSILIGLGPAAAVLANNYGHNIAKCY